MKKLLAVVLMTGLVGQAFAQTAPTATPVGPAPAGAAGAGVASAGALSTGAMIGIGAAVVAGVAVAVSGGGSSHGNDSTPAGAGGTGGTGGTTGTTGTTGTH